MTATARARWELDIKDSYYNMLEKIQPHFHLVETPARPSARRACPWNSSPPASTRGSDDDTTAGAGCGRHDDRRGVYYDATGNELKKFAIKDGAGLVLARTAASV